MKKIIKILNDYRYEVVIGEKHINLEDCYDVFIIYDRTDITVETLREVDVYIMQIFLQLIVEIENGSDKKWKLRLIKS